MALVKTVLGLALASVKTVEGLAAASVKTILGLDSSASATYTLKETIGTDTSNGSTIASAANRKFVGGSWSAGQTYSLTKVMVRLLKATNGGSAGTFSLELRADNGSGSPASTVTETSTTVFNWADIGTTVADFEFLFAGTSSISSGSPYWLVAKISSAGDANNHYLWRCGNTSTGEQENSELGTTTWAVLSTRQLYAKLYASP